MNVAWIVVGLVAVVIGVIIGLMLFALYNAKQSRSINKVINNPDKLYEELTKNGPIYEKDTDSAGRRELLIKKEFNPKLGKKGAYEVTITRGPASGAPEEKREEKTKQDVKGKVNKKSRKA